MHDRGHPRTRPPPPPTAAPHRRPVHPDPLAFFRAQEETCRQFAAQQGITAVDGERFRDAKVVRDLGDGTTEIADGRGTRLVVDPGRGIVLPASGKPSDVMPPPYAFTCSEKVFVGASGGLIVPLVRWPRRCRGDGAGCDCCGRREARRRDPVFARAAARSWRARTR